MKLINVLRKPKVSIILPVYNVEKFLEQCLDSIAAQTFKDYELICVNDGSSDSSPKILEAYAKKDNRIKIINQNNQTLGAARNNGFKSAKGKYVIWLDSDDFFESGMLEEAYNKAEETNADIVLFAYKTYNNKTGEFSAKKGLDINLLKERKVFSRKEIPNSLMQVTFPNCWTKLYKRNFVRRFKLKYQVIPNSEDVYFTFTALCLADRISYVDKAFVNYRINRNDSNEAQKSAHPLCCIQADTALFDEMNRRGVYNALKYSYANHIVDHYSYVFIRLSDSKDALAAVKKELKESFFPYTHVLDYPDEAYVDLQTVRRLREL